MRWWSRVEGSHVGAVGGTKAGSVGRRAGLISRDALSLQPCRLIVRNVAAHGLARLKSTVYEEIPPSLRHAGPDLIFSKWAVLKA